ncbi:biotin--[acetyl-CoA-carboxylase] ligase [Paenibacillus ehimensis]|uniref:Bifunctional ligase/repressor BirA n=1 Tax=Paenibacillus ehimensis TaxID=79264 RepID=A0ABT8VDU1_9BACL|nr:biotin--[acetyl-CoA-carboxylase] ligase [Paenibacillus ehimensis]MDO3679135.1 biotin--[acetyl-CoA-carboxylase] ligase [Paenibacillus ehimensis]MEC0207704.1 biotin--[acetyl-CoA-carboxylase] ligase [Paenibacillus ehimensis]
MMTDRLIGLFEQSDGKFLSGEQLSEELGVSRTAVWKQIERLRQQGYRFEAVSRKGYRLLSKPDRLDMSRLQLKLETERFGRFVKYYGQVESTQIVAAHCVEEGAEEGTLILAEQQTAGKGRMGRTWHSPVGKGIWMSLILKPVWIPLLFTPQLTLLVAVALCRAIRSTTGVEAGIKWPNDLLVGGKKVAGILLESSAEDERLQHIIAGVGISVNLQSDDFPPELRDAATSLAIEAGRQVDRIEVLSRFLLEWEQLYELYRREGFAPIKLLWEALTVSLHRNIRCRTPQGEFEGFAEGIDEHGALQLRTADGSVRKLYSADISFG